MFRPLPALQITLLPSLGPFSAQLGKIFYSSIMRSCHYKGSWTYMMQALQLGSIIDCQLRFMHYQQAKLVIVELNTCVTNGWCCSSGLHLYKFGFAFFPSISAPYKQLPTQRISESKLVFWLIVSPRDSSQHKHLGQKCSKSNKFIHAQVEPEIHITKMPWKIMLSFQDWISRMESHK